MVIHHICHVRSCVNPHHLVATTPEKNSSMQLEIYVPPPKKILSIKERFLKHADVGEHDECWNWTGNTSVHGYGISCAIKGIKTPAHRVSYKIYCGEVPDGLQIDHLCRNRLCVNPMHLEAVTIQENIRRGMAVSSINRRKTHCKYGHPFDEKNTRIWTGEKIRMRICRTCRRKRESYYYNRNKSKDKKTLSPIAA